MRIALVHSFYRSDSPSGENAVVLVQAEQLRKAGHHVQLISRQSDAQSQERFYPLRSAARTATGLGSAPSSELQAFKPDVVHLHNGFPNWGTRWLRTWGHRTVVTLHNFRSVCAAATLFRDGHECTECLSLPGLPAIQHKCYRDSRLASIPVAAGTLPGGGLREVIRSAAMLITLNESAQQIYAQLSERPVRLIPNFVEAGRFSAQPERDFVYVGRLSEEKGVRALLDQWPSTKRLDLIGAGPLEELVRTQATLRPSIKYLGSLAREDLLEQLPEYRALILPSLCPEGLPTVLLEALGHGVPVVISKNVAAAESVAKAGAAATYAPEGQGDELRTAMHKVDRDRVGMQTAALRLHASAFSPDIWLQRIEATYREVASRAENLERR